MIDLFREWDEDASGVVSKKEFRRAMQHLGLAAARAEVDALFDEFDPDGSGAIEFRELNKALRRGNDVELRADLQPGAAGEIEAAPKGSPNQPRPPPATARPQPGAYAAARERAVGGAVTRLGAQGAYTRVTRRLRLVSSEGTMSLQSDYS